MDSRSIENYAGRIFGYCLRRLNNIDDAEDLSQEILLEIIKSVQKTDIENFDAWVWKIAHNRYVHYINKNQRPTISLEDSGIIETLADSGDYYEDSSDEVNAAFRAVHSISKSHRDILIDFYINELSYLQISQKYSLPVNTVKSRLYYGKKKLKERWKMKLEEKKVYSRINWYISGNGDVNPYLYLSRQTARAILTVCYNKAMTIDEISLATGIPCLYIEDEIKILLQGEIISVVNCRYITNIIIHSEDLTAKIERFLKSFSVALAEKTVTLLDDYHDHLMQIGFLGSDKPKGSLWWLMVPVVLREACEEARRLNGHVARVPFPPRKDGGKGWIFVNVSPAEKLKCFSGCNGYYRDNSLLTYYWSSKYFSSDINKYLLKLEDVESLGLDADISRMNEVLIAEGIKYNIIEKAAGSYTWKIAVFTREQMKKLDSLKIDIAKHLSGDLLGVVNKIYEMDLSDTPAHLHDQIKGAFGAELNTIIAMVCDLLEESGKLDPQEDDYFTSQILMTIK